MRAYLHKNRNSLSMDCLVLYCFQLAMAVSYLESKKFVHRFSISTDISTVYVLSIMNSPLGGCEFDSRPVCCQLVTLDTRQRGLIVLFVTDYLSQTLWFIHLFA